MALYRYQLITPAISTPPTNSLIIWMTPRGLRNDTPRYRNSIRYTPYSKATKAPDAMEIGRLNTRYRVSANGSSANTPCSAADANTNPNENWLPSSISAALPTRFT